MEKKTEKNHKALNVNFRSDLVSQKITLFFKYSACKFLGETMLIQRLIYSKICINFQLFVELINAHRIKNLQI